jgi:hypothetical protein
MKLGSRSHPFLKDSNYLVVHLATNLYESINTFRPDDKGKIRLASEVIAFRRHSVDSASTLPTTETLP